MQNLCNETKGQSEAEQPHTQALGDFKHLSVADSLLWGGIQVSPRPFESLFGLA